MDYIKTPATEGLFDPEATTDKLLAAVKENISKKITTVDEAADLENRLSEEAAEFNGMLNQIATAMRQCQAGEITKEECQAAAAPCVKALKERCKALELADVTVKDDDITENEIAMLREYIVGCKDILAAHKQCLQDCPQTQNAENASESVMSAIESIEPATEGLFDPTVVDQIRYGSDAKNATLLYKNAKKLYSMGSKDKATEYMQKAKKLYQKCLDDAKKAFDAKKIERTVKTKIGITKIEDTDKKFEVYDNSKVGHFNFPSGVVAYFEDRIDTCEAYLRQWSNKAGKLDLKATKEMLKKERKEEKARIRAERKAAKAKAAEEATLIADEISALESMMDGYELDLQLDAAMEAEGTDGPATNASAIGAKIRGAFAKLRNAKKAGDVDAAEKAAEEVKAAATELEQAEAGADEEGKKKLSTAAKIGIAAGSAALLAAGIIGGGQLLKNADPEKIGSAGKLLVKVSETIVNATKKGAGKVADTAKDVAGAVSRKADSIVSSAKGKAAVSKATKTQNAEKTTGNVTAAFSAIKSRLAKAGDNSKAGAIAEKVTELEAKAQKANGNTKVLDKIFAQIKDYNMKLNEIGVESYTSGADFLASLAMEEANFTDEVTLTEIEPEDGRAFDDDDAIDDAIVGVETECEDDDDDEDEEADESVLESTLEIFKLEDGLDPTED